MRIILFGIVLYIAGCSVPPKSIEGKTLGCWQDNKKEVYAGETIYNGNRIGREIINIKVDDEKPSQVCIK